MKVLLIAPFYDRNATGESWSTYKWIEGISRQHEVTVLTVHPRDWDASRSPIQAKEVINWPSLEFPKAFTRLNRELKPAYVRFYFQARKWIKRVLAEGRSFDLVHQISPLALRYPCPARGLGLKYLIGPLAGSLETPLGFRQECSDRQWYRKLRNFDRVRIKRDPWLRGSYAEAAAVIGVAPYVQEILEPARIQRFEIASETGVETVSATPRSGPAPGEPLRLLFAGRIIRTKGVRDAIRAVAIAARSHSVVLDILGAGDDESACRSEVARLGVQGQVRFHGHVSRAEVDDWYRQAHVFLFPSFREPSGNVVFEALGQGLPVITSALGGPGYVVNETCGARVPTHAPQQYAEALAAAIIQLAQNPSCIESLSRGAVERMQEFSLWERKIERMLVTYRSIWAGQCGATSHPLPYSIASQPW